ncbi:MAG TPA: hypothetical protein VER57_05585, partial [Cyanobium sp.]|nr:hypothetical protein [Cyanobium sp.]
MPASAPVVAPASPVSPAEGQQPRSAASLPRALPAVLPVALPLVLLALVLVQALLRPERPGPDDPLRLL